jgi:signal transduction histidine kinase/ligand-binding sensor domain-containing protein
MAVHTEGGNQLVTLRSGCRRVLGVLAAIVVAGCPSAFALNPALDISQYAHTAWRIREGFTQGTISALAQTPDGYLWLGTEFGLIRFDGVKTVRWQPTADQSLPSPWISSLLTARDGTLWIGTSKGLASLRDGKVTQYPQLAGQSVLRLVEDREGFVWAGTLGVPSGRLCAIQRGNVRCDGEDGRLGLGVVGLFEDSKGSLWVGVKNGLWRWKPGPPVFHPVPGELDSIRSFDEHNGALLLCTKSGIQRLADGGVERYALAGVEKPYQPEQLFRDREGSLWIGTSRQGLLHVHEGRTDRFASAEGLSGDSVWSIIRDREGTIWVATDGGLDQFRDVAFPTFTMNQGLSGNSVSSVLATRNGTLWLAGPEGLDRWNDSHMTGVRMVGRPGNTPQSLFEDYRGRLWVSWTDGVGYLENDRFLPIHGIPGGLTRSIAEDPQRNLWIANQSEGLFRVSADGATQHFSWSMLGHEDFATTLAGDPGGRGLWLGFFNGGMALFGEGRTRESYTDRDGLGAGRVNSFRFDRAGVLWIATAGGLSRLKDGRLTTLTSRNGLPCDEVYWTLEDELDFVWLYMPCGLVRIPKSQFGDPTRALLPAVFDSTDGVRSRPAAASQSPAAAKSLDGRLWFVSVDGVRVVDPDHLSLNNLPPPVHVEHVLADHTTHADVSGPLRLPALTRDLEIDYTALSLVAPEKNQFRVKLEGWDRDWVEMGNGRQKFYSSLPPRTYRFRVIGSNNSGVWNETGDVLEFSIAPAFYQRRSVQSAVVIAFIGLLWAMYRYRLSQIAHVYDVSLQERVNERTRIARDLHDTLLQNFHGVLFRFQAIANRVADPDIKHQFEGAIDQASQAINEGRDAVQNLRASSIEASDLPTSISTLGRELAAADAIGARPVVDVTVEGTPRDLRPVIRDDIHRTAAEALRNAFRHAQARRIEVNIRYDERELTLQVRDDGKGMDPKSLAEYKPGHFGLPGMRERATVIGGKLDVWSEVGSGTEVELTIPASAAYALPRARAWWSLFPRKAGTNS